MAITPTIKHTQSAVIIMIAVLCFVFITIGCNKKNKHGSVGAIVNRRDLAALTADHVTSLISDSGITRYRITTARWEVYDKAKPPHWIFPRGVYFERFNEQLEAVAFLEADSAYYNEDSQNWSLYGNVHALNLQGEEFLTEHLFWDQKKDTIFSDTLITINRPTDTIVGLYGFKSNKTMTVYTIFGSSGTFQLNEE